MNRYALLLLIVLHPVAAMTAAEATHLVQRTGFGVTEARVELLQTMPYDQGVDTLVAAASHDTRAATPPPDWVNDPLPRLRDLKDAPQEEKMAFFQNLRHDDIELAGWWMREIVSTPTPLAEHMTLFWHNHFTSSLKKDKLPQLLYRQNVLLRSQALGNYKTLLHAIARDPAMIVFLDNRSNRAGEPNENFARELLELFTLGQGNYTEQDVKEAARAFTGWTLIPPDGSFFERPRLHDDGRKTFLGHTGNLDGDDILDLILAQPQAAEFIVGELWTEFVSATPDPQQVKTIAAQFRRNWEIAPVVAALLKTPQFRNPANAGTLTKSPVDLVAGTLVTLGVPVTDGRFPAVAAGLLGQTLFNPPNVRGWPGGDSWINSQTLVAREQFLESLTRGFDAAPTPMMPTAMSSAPPADNSRAELKTAFKAESLGGAGREKLAAAAQSLNVEHYLASFTSRYPPAQQQQLLLAMAPVALPSDDDTAEPAADAHLRELLLDPAYQLK